jgi:hypothetical protein
MDTADWHSLIASEMSLSPDAARQLRDLGFLIVPGPKLVGGIPQLSKAYDQAVAAADPADVGIGSSTRVRAFVNGGPEFDRIYVHPPLLAACCEIIGGPFKLSGMRARTLEPGAPMEALHADVKHRADGWPIVGFIWMIDTFVPENGATRFVPRSHLDARDPREVLESAMAPHSKQILACGPAGSLIIFNGSVWHSHTSNTSSGRRRSVQGHFIPRDAQASTDHRARLHQETFQRIHDLAKYILYCAA